MWREIDADPPACPSAGDPAVAARTLADGYPHGRALCPVCGRFVRLRRDGTLPVHRSWRGDRTRAEAERRREWFNAIGW